MTFDEMTELISNFYYGYNPNIGYYIERISAMDKVLAKLITINPEYTDTLIDYLAENIVTKFIKGDEKYKYTLNILSRLLDSEAYINLILYSREYIRRYGGEQDKLDDVIVDSMSDASFDKLLEESYTRPSRVILNILLRHLPEELREEYNRKYVGPGL
jgi:hypothetical protein